MMLLGTNDIRGIIVCHTAVNDNTYTISCDYVSSCSFSGCFYNLTSMSDTISEKIEGNNSTMIERNEVRQEIPPHCERLHWINSTVGKHHFQ